MVLRREVSISGSRRRRRTAATVLEYCLLLAMIVLVLVVVVVPLSPRLARFTANLSQDIQAASDTDTYQVERGARHGMGARSGNGVGDPATPSEMAGFRTFAIPVLTVAALLGTTGAALIWRRKRRARRAAEDVAEDTETEAPPQLRSLAKRQQLWRMLFAEGDLLLSNGLQVRHLMTSDPVTVPPSAGMDEMRQVMEAEGLHHLLVCQGDRLLGVISDRDLREDRAAKAKDIMRSQVHTVAPDASLGTAIHVLFDKHISCLPVVDRDRLRGILSTTDLVLTLQCAIQLWLRMANSSNAGTRWVEELRALSHDVQHEVTTQREHIAKLQRLLDEVAAGLPARDAQPARDAFARQAETLLTAASGLATRLESVHDRLQGRSQEWMAMNDLRTDQTTGLANRWELETILDLVLAMRQRHQDPCCLVLAAVEWDGGTRRAGIDMERLLAAVRSIVTNVRAGDFTARLDDALFAVVLTHTSQDGAVEFCQHLCQVAAELPPPFSLQFRTVIAVPQDDERSSELISRAITLLAEAGQPGPPSIPVADVEMPGVQESLMPAL